MSRFSAAMEKALCRAGWFPGRSDTAELSQFEFELHKLAKDFVREFGGLMIRHVVVESCVPNADEPRMRAAFNSNGLQGCVPVARTNYWADSSMWISEDGRVYLADEVEIILAGNRVEEGFETLVFEKEISASYPRWNVESFYSK